MVEKEVGLGGPRLFLPVRRQILDSWPAVAHTPNVAESRFDKKAGGPRSSLAAKPWNNATTRELPTRIQNVNRIAAETATP